MLAHCQATPKLGWLASVIIALVHLGVRISELAGLRWRDVDLQRNMITVADERASRRRKLAGTARTTKGKRSRKIPIHPRLRALLTSLPRTTDGWVFHAENGTRLRPSNVLYVFIREVITPLAEKFPTPAGEIGFKDGRLHSFRHFFVSQAFVGGASQSEIQEWVGHANSEMVEHYRHLGQKEALRRMEQIRFVDSDASEQERSG
jgi:integrase